MVMRMSGSESFVQSHLPALPGGELHVTLNRLYDLS